MTAESQTRALSQHLSSTHPGEPVHLVAHSIGAVWAFTLASRSPELVASIVSIEGNFSLRDAFWSGSLAAMSERDAETAIGDIPRDARAWLISAGVRPTDGLVARAEEALAYQPWRTVWESARAVIAATSGPEYESMVKSVFEKIPVHLIAGERSSEAWDVPDWARTAAATDTVIPGVGHMMMLEDPRRFGTALSTILD